MTNIELSEGKKARCLYCCSPLEEPKFQTITLGPSEGEAQIAAIVFLCAEHGHMANHFMAFLDYVCSYREAIARTGLIVEGE